MSNTYQYRPRQGKAVKYNGGEDSFHVMENVFGEDRIQFFEITNSGNILLVPVKNGLASCYTGWWVVEHFGGGDYFEIMSDDEFKIFYEEVLQQDEEDGVR